MRATFTNAFKEQAIKKALSRSFGTSIQSISDEIGVGYSTLQKWIQQSKSEQLNTSTTQMTKQEKRPVDWSNAQKLDLLIKCGALDEQAQSALCRENGIYPHHLEQWKEEFSAPVNRTEAPRLKREFKALQKELRRKEKALAETAALLVLQKKVNQIWNEYEDD